jgi:cell division protein FtsL
MNTITLVLAIIANIIAIYTLLWCMSTSTQMLNVEDGIRECATRARSNKLKLDTLDNKVNKPKAKRGRPRKNAPKPHVVNGVQ